jgi:hypothetical protein
MVARYGLPAIPLYNDFRSRPALDLQQLNALIDSGRLRFALVSPFLMSRDYSEALDLFASRCENVSLQAGVPLLSGYLLYGCQPGGR